MRITIRNSMHGVLLLLSLEKQRELIQGPIIDRAGLNYPHITRLSYKFSFGVVT